MVKSIITMPLLVRTLDQSVVVFLTLMNLQAMTQVVSKTSWLMIHGKEY